MDHRSSSRGAERDRSDSRKRGRSVSPSQTFKKPHIARRPRSIVRKVKSVEKKSSEQTKLTSFKSKTNKMADTDKTKIDPLSQILDRFNSLETKFDERMNELEKKVDERMNELEKKVDNIDSKLDKRITVIESKLFDVEKRQDQCEVEIKTMQTNQSTCEDVVTNAETLAKTSLDKAQETEQYLRNFNIRIFNVEEKKNETTDQCEKAVLKLFKDKLGVEVPIEAIDVIHRLGTTKTVKPRLEKKKEGDKDTETVETEPAKNDVNDGIQTRPIIVRFLSRRMRREVLEKRKNLKKKTLTEIPIIITEDLSKQNYQLFSKAKESVKYESVWSRDGTIFGKQVLNNLKVPIKSFADIEGPPITKVGFGYASRGYGTLYRRGRGRGNGRARGHLRGGIQREQSEGDKGVNTANVYDPLSTSDTEMDQTSNDNDEVSIFD